jgi:hypothetical protein
MNQNLKTVRIYADQSLRPGIKKIRKVVLVVLMAGLSFSYSSAQKQPTEKKGSLEIFLGGNVGGPASQMYDLMVQYHFDATIYGFLGTLTNPEYGVTLPFTGQIAYTYRIGDKSKVGLILSYSSLQEVGGASVETGYISFLTVSFSNISVIPVYRYDVFKFLELQAGPALMFNNGKRTDYGVNQSYSAVGAGLLTGLNFRIWDTRITYGKISTSYLFATQSKMGPFSASDGITDQQASIPESSIGFSHLMIGFVFGIHI